MVVSLGCRKDAFIMMSELNQINAISLAVISVDFLAALQIIQTHREVFAAGHQILAIVADVHRVYLLFLTNSTKSGKRRCFSKRKMMVWGDLRSF